MNDAGGDADRPRNGQYKAPTTPLTYAMGKISITKWSTQGTDHIFTRRDGRHLAGSWKQKTLSLEPKNAAANPNAHKRSCPNSMP